MECSGGDVGGGDVGAVGSGVEGLGAGAGAEVEGVVCGGAEGEVGEGCGGSADAEDVVWFEFGAGDVFGVVAGDVPGFLVGCDGDGGLEGVVGVWFARVVVGGFGDVGGDEVFDGGVWVECGGELAGGGWLGEEEKLGEGGGWGVGFLGGEFEWEGVFAVEGGHGGVAEVGGEAVDGDVVVA